MTGALSDIRVIETGTLLAGPFCGQLLGDFGAEVIKLEDPGKGDPMRQWGREKPHGQSLWWPVVARNKKSVTCNLRTPAGQDIVRKLVARSDVLLENFRPGTLERWGLGYDVLSEINPRLILVRVTGYGQTGPYAPRAGFGSIGEAMGGIRHVTGEPDRAPSRAGISLGDSLAATYAAYGTLAALHARERTDRGQVVDSAIYEAVLAMMESLLPEWAVAGYQRERTGAILPNVAPSNVYPTDDGADVLIAANQDTVFRRLTEVMARPDLAADPRYATHGARGAHQAELDDIIAAWTRTRPAAELLDDLHAAGVPAGGINTAADILADPHIAAREAVVRVPHPDFGELPMQNVAPRLSADPGSVRWAGPALGQHNDEIYGDLLGLSPADRDDLRTRGVI
ncbi:CoA transferase [Hamadaea sp. NPDC051192]|uniref:CaiB/BaiF CoA transferase family protein n=1 Tax=Hamadaea sp. NPDC051192 TaxID=3154940 RepID=UPI00341B8DB2